MLETIFYEYLKQLTLITMNPDLITQLESRLAALAPVSLIVEDESYLHAGHAGSRDGASHFRVHIVAPCFENKPMIAQHRLVYDLLRDLMPYPIHALALQTKAPIKGNT